MSIYKNNNGELDLIAGGTLYAESAIGSIIPFGGAVIPTSFLLCDGSAISRTDYAELFAVIGTAFGAGDGSTTFNIPDLRECVPVGVDENTTQTITRHDTYTLGQFKDDQLGTHNHPLASVTTATFNNAGVPVGVANNNAPTTATHGKQVGVNYIIKAKKVGMPADFASAVGDVVVDKNTYSTSETVVGKWINDKPIYRKTFTGLTRSSAAGQWVDTGANITGMNIGIIVWFMAFDTTYNINRNAIDMRIDDGKLKFYTGFENPFNICTIEYTKTTD